jgi:hypothetical protein
MTIADNWLSFSGKFLVPESPDTEKYAVIAGEFEFADIIYKPNGDGTYDAVHKIAPIRIMLSKGDKKLVAKVKNKNSVRLRGALWHHYQTLDLPEDKFDDYYQMITDQMIINLSSILNMLGQ